MTVYVDDAYIPHRVWNKHTNRWVESDGWCHLTAGTQAELHAFARKLGLRRAYFQEGTPRGSPNPFWHYDVTRGKRWQAVRLGAVEITQQESVRLALERAERAATAAASKPATAAPKLQPGIVCARPRGGRPPTQEDLDIIAGFATELARRGSSPVKRKGIRPMTDFDFAADITARARWARDHNNGHPRMVNGREARGRTRARRPGIPRRRGIYPAAGQAAAGW